MRENPSFRFGAGLRQLRSAGFDAARMNVVLNGQAARIQVSVLVQRDAIEEVFPKIEMAGQCLVFVERNLEPLRHVAQAKLQAGRFLQTPGAPAGDLQIELRTADLLRAHRWMIV
jgi:hypothetical protein